MARERKLLLFQLQGTGRARPVKVRGSSVPIPDRVKGIVIDDGWPRQSGSN